VPACCCAASHPSLPVTMDVGQKRERPEDAAPATVSETRAEGGGSADGGDARKPKRPRRDAKQDRGRKWRQQQARQEWKSMDKKKKRLNEWRKGSEKDHIALANHVNPLWEKFYKVRAVWCDVMCGPVPGQSINRVALLCMCAQTIVPASEWEQFESTLRTPLPTSFRLSSLSDRREQLLAELRTSLQFDPFKLGDIAVHPPQ